MRTSRLYLPQPLQSGQTLTLDKEQSHYLCRVLRAKTGQQVELFNDSDHIYLATLTQASPKAACLQVEETRPCQSESPLHITLVQTLARGERMDYALQKATELGVQQIDLMYTQRCEVKLDEKRLQNRLRHWREVMIHAAQQSGRCRVPTLSPPRTLTQWLQSLPETHTSLMLHPQAHTRATDLKALLQADQPVHVLIGPEGGFSEGEYQHLERAGALPLRLGPRILRTETAGPAMIAILQALAGDLLN